MVTDIRQAKHTLLLEAPGTECMHKWSVTRLLKSEKMHMLLVEQTDRHTGGFRSIPRETITVFMN